jgi:TatD DNase family protein
LRRADTTLLWGFGAHPGVPSALAECSQDVVAAAAKRHVLIGEIGLDRRGSLADQTSVLRRVLHACAGQPVLLSLHSTGRTSQLLDLLEQQPHPGAILHWFNGTPRDIERGIDIGCYFSVNHSMSDERLLAIPRARMLPETDFPASRRATLARKPGDVRALEHRLANRDSSTPGTVRAAFYRNLGAISAASGALDRLPAELQADIARA